MRLDQWRKSKSLTQQELAEKLSVHVQYVSAIECGRRLPGMQLAVRIRELTHGAVTPNDFYDLPPASGSTLSQPAGGGRGNGAGRVATRPGPIADDARVSA